MNTRCRTLLRATARGAASAAVVGATISLMACGPPTPPTADEVVAVGVTQLPLSPDDLAWRNSPVFAAPLVLQDLVEPRLLKVSTTGLQVQAAHDDRRIAFRLSWPDDLREDSPGPARFSDACAVQLPVSAGANVPAPQMGETGGPVEITYWRATWQASVNGRGDTIRDLYPNAAVDHYPFEAASLTTGSVEQLAMANRYAPARALSNAMAGPHERPVEDLLAEGPGTLAPGPSLDSDGDGRWGEKGWSVVLVRRIPGGLDANRRMPVAFAVWQGSNDEVGARKMRTGWVSLLVEAKP